MPEVRCKDCQRLWAEYVSAVLEHVRLDRQVYFASHNQGPGQLQPLRNSLEAAAITAKSLRERIRRHQDSHKNAYSAPD